MSVPRSINNITTFGDRIIYRMSQTYPVAAGAPDIATDALFGGYEIEYV